MLLSCWGGQFSGAFTVSFREGNWRNKRSVPIIDSNVPKGRIPKHTVDGSEIWRSPVGMVNIHLPPTAKVLATCPVDYTSQWKRSATTPNPAWPCNTALPTGTLAIRRTFSYLQRASFGSTSPWKRWRQALQQSLCPWTSFYHCWSSSTQWHRTHCSRMFLSYQHDLATQRFPLER